jgi:hypothetical protein
LANHHLGGKTHFSPIAHQVATSVLCLLLLRCASCTTAKFKSLHSFIHHHPESLLSVFPVFISVFNKLGCFAGDQQNSKAFTALFITIQRAFSLSLPVFFAMFNKLGCFAGDQKSFSSDIVPSISLLTVIVG